jgi:DNA-binding HxlR family transcriptional regulator
MNDPSVIEMSCGNDCPVRRAAEVVGHKWATLIVRDLLTGRKRYSELERSLTGISPKVLSDRLQQLEKQRVITRTEYPTVPPTTDYQLTELGKNLEGVIRALYEFGLSLNDGSPPEAWGMPASARSDDR